MTHKEIDPKCVNLVGRESHYQQRVEAMRFEAMRFEAVKFEDTGFRTKVRGNKA